MQGEVALHNSGYTTAQGKKNTFQPYSYILCYFYYLFIILIIYLCHKIYAIFYHLYLITNNYLTTSNGLR